jgi:hypothetical protein
LFEKWILPGSPYLIFSRPHRSSTTKAPGTCEEKGRARKRIALARGWRGFAELDRRKPSRNGKPRRFSVWQTRICL